MYFNENRQLCYFLGFRENEVRNYNVFVTELCDGNLNKQNHSFTLTQSIDICKQLLKGLRQLEQSDKCHNDLKPENILYKTSGKKHENGDQELSIKIADFGTAGRTGGTPGWTWPCFVGERNPGRSDMYSTALLILYVMSDSRELFYRLRDNYIEGQSPWLTEFRADPLIALVINMMSLKLTVHQCIERWAGIANSVWLLREIDLNEMYDIPWPYFQIQDNLDAIHLADATLLDKSVATND